VGRAEFEHIYILFNLGNVLESASNSLF